MAGKKVKNEVEGVRLELQSLSEAVWALRDHVKVQLAAAAAANGQSRSGPEVAADLAERGEDRGIVVTRGAVRNASGSHEYRWDLETDAATLLAIDDGDAAQLLAAIGHRQRLAIIKSIIDAPTTAAELVTSLELGTTGAAYHHLNVLQAANLVVQESRGLFSIAPDRVSAVLAIFAGLLSVSSTQIVETPITPEPHEETGGKRKKRKTHSGAGSDD